MSGPKTLRMLSWMEGISLLLLLLVAMPLKYMWGLPLAVRIVGSLHGVLFLALLSSGIQGLFDKSVTKALVLRVLGWSLVPFGFLVIDDALRADPRVEPDD